MSITTPSVVVADTVTRRPPYEFDIVGAFDHVWVKRLPSEPKNFVVGGLVIGSRRDEAGMHPVTARLLDPFNTLVLEETSTVELEPTGDSWLVHGRVVIPFAAVVFEKYGHHRLVLMVGSSVTAEYPIIVTDSPGY